MGVYYQLLRRILFTLPPEFSHHFTLACLQQMAEWNIIKPPQNLQPPIHLLGLTFKNRIGAAAGIDKNGDYIAGLSAIGFGFVELGTVTPLPQAGQSKPRLFRLPEVDAIINRMGFNNKGIDYLITQVQKYKEKNTYPPIIGINIGKNATTEIKDIAEDYKQGLTKAYPWADYITINISSPNTKGLRDLQEEKAFIALVTTLKNTQRQLAEQTNLYKPMLIKIAPDLTDDALKILAKSLLELQIDGVIATNTTISRAHLEHLPQAQEAGGLSGRPLMEQSTHVVQCLRHELGPDFPIIAVGGIMSLADAQAKRRVGADLLQVYTGFIYQGPQLVRDIISLV